MTASTVDETQQQAKDDAWGSHRRLLADLVRTAGDLSDVRRSLFDATSRIERIQRSHPGYFLASTFVSLQDISRLVSDVVSDIEARISGTDIISDVVEWD